MDGYQICRELNLDTKAVYNIVLSAIQSIENRQNAIVMFLNVELMTKFLLDDFLEKGWE